MALGATAPDVRRMVIRDGVRLVLIGIACGAPVAIALAFLIRQLLLVEPLDPVAFLVVPLLLTACAAVASYLPARRASARDPLVALRAE
jgi:ABC-type antimicrobial peptide transport system permease subunit